MAFRIDSPGSVAGTWVDGSPFASIDGTVIAAQWMNALQEEVDGVIEGEGITLSKLDNGQLRQAILALVARVAGVELPFTAPSSLTAGQGFLSGDVFGVVKASAAIATSAILLVRGIFTLPKVTADTFALHARVYWDNGLGKLTTTAAGNRSAGVVTVAAGPGTTVASLLLQGPPNL